MNYLYHRVPPNLTGSILYPLNTLKQKLPALYVAHAKKYLGRESLTQQIIPPLGCLWNDVLHFSPVHPNLIREALISAGFTPTTMQWFQVNPMTMNFNSQNTAIYLSPPKKYRDFTKSAEAFRPFNYASLPALSKLPEATLTYYQMSQKQGDSPLLFHRIPHILYQGELHLKDMTIIST
ncbi:MAG: hypothetical protein F6J95_020930 [Leptolyngbya sp. SIO1E4]|nr:hypothetical protein [Leptolyngbya sp. SIO1E4]